MAVGDAVVGALVGAWQYCGHLAGHSGANRVLVHGTMLQSGVSATPLHSATVGCAVGECVGAAEGDTEGVLVVGVPVGSADGRFVG